MLFRSPEKDEDKTDTDKEDETDKTDTDNTTDGEDKE